MKKYTRKRKKGGGKQRKNPFTKKGNATKKIIKKSSPKKLTTRKQYKPPIAKIESPNTIRKKAQMDRDRQMLSHIPAHVIKLRKERKRDLLHQRVLPDHYYNLDKTEGTFLTKRGKNVVKAQKKSNINENKQLAKEMADKELQELEEEGDWEMAQAIQMNRHNDVY